MGVVLLFLVLWVRGNCKLSSLASYQSNEGQMSWMLWCLFLWKVFLRAFIARYKLLELIYSTFSTFQSFMKRNSVRENKVSIVSNMVFRNLFVSFSYSGTYYKPAFSLHTAFSYFVLICDVIKIHTFVFALTHCAFLSYTFFTERRFVTPPHKTLLT